MCRLLFWLLILVPISTFGQKSIVVAFSLNECANCYNSLSLLKQKDSTIEIKFILEDRYAKEVDKIEDLYFENILTRKIVFNSNMYQQMIGENDVSMLYLINDGLIVGSYILKSEINIELIRHFNSLDNDIDTLVFKDIDFSTFTLRDIKPLGNKIFIPMNAENKIVILDRFNTKLVKEIVLSDSLLLKAYYKYYGETEKSQKMLAFFKLRDYKNIGTISTVEYRKGIVYVGVCVKDIIVSNNFNDTVETGFQCIFTFNNKGDYLNCAIIYDYFDARSDVYKRQLFDKFTDTSYFVSDISSILPDGESILLRVNKYDPHKKLKDNYVLARFNLDRDLNYRFSEYLPLQKPDFYKRYIRNRYTFYASRDYSYACLQLSNEVFDLKKNSSLRTSIPVDNSKIESPTTFNQGIYDFEIIDSIAYYILYDKKLNTYYHVSLDLQSNTLVHQRILKPFSTDMYAYYMRLDPLNPNYVFRPLSENTIVRQRIESIH